MRLRILSRETGSAVPSRVSPLILHTQAESDWLMVLTHGVHAAFRDGVHPYRQPLSSIQLSSIGSGPSLSCPAIAYRWRSPPRVCRHRTSSSQSSSSNGCCLFRKPDGPIFVRLSFLTPTVGTVNICDGVQYRRNYKTQRTCIRSRV